MRAYDIIAKKRDGGKLSPEEIDFMIQGYTKGGIPDYQMAAWAMAVYLRGMDSLETAQLTMSMVHSGDSIDLSAIAGTKVDKHSTGGVGDTTTLVLAPLVAAAGAPVAKMSGRGLGHTGGTLDKFESIPGFRVNLTPEEFIRNVNTVKAAVVGQTGNLAPADKKLYALRDVTATVSSIPLIASSVMSKKIAAGADGIVLDVKTGSGAFMKSPEDSFRLAKAMVEIGTQVGRRTVALITGMEQPLGFAVGNALEVKEAIAVLEGRGPKDLEELCLILGARMLMLAGLADTPEAGRQRLEVLLADGTAREKFKQLISAQGGNAAVVENPELLPAARIQREVAATEGGFVKQIAAETIGLAATVLGAGRETKDSPVDPAVGIVLTKKIGDRAAAGEPLAVVHSNDPDKAALAASMITGAYTFADAKPPVPKLIYGEIGEPA